MHIHRNVCQLFQGNKTGLPDEMLQLSLTHLCLTIVIWTSDTFENDFEIKQELKKIVEGGC